MISRELEAVILRLHHAEKWTVGAIVDHLHLHHDVVERVLRQNGVRPSPVPRGSRIDRYLPFILETWRKYPTLTAARLYAMCRERGYPGRPDHFRHLVAPLRPRPREAFLRLRTLPGEQAQVDWAHFGKLRVGRAERPLLGFVLVLSWSRKIFLRFFLGQHIENFLRGHVLAFHAWNGVPRTVLTDNLKSAVMERHGEAIRFHPVYYDLAGHYRFEPRPVAPYRGNEKGRVERSVRYVRGSFFAAREWKDLDDLNAQAEQWCEGLASERPWVQDPRRTVCSAFEEERRSLLALPGTPFPTDERREVSVGKVPYVRFDHNDYSVPHELVRQLVTVVADLRTVRILSNGREVARHRRSFDRRAVIEDPEHLRALRAAKRQARAHHGQHRLFEAAPPAESLLKELAQRGQNLGSATARLLELLQRYGAARLERAIREVLQRDVPHVPAVRQVLEQWQKETGTPGPVAVPLPPGSPAHDVVVRPHELGPYDDLAEDRGPQDPEEKNDARNETQEDGGPGES